MKRAPWTTIGLFLASAGVMVIPAVAIGFYWAEEVCRGVQCGLATLVYGIPGIWAGLTAVGFGVMWWLERRR